MGNKLTMASRLGRGGCCLQGPNPWRHFSLIWRVNAFAQLYGNLFYHALSLHPLFPITPGECSPPSNAVWKDWTLMPSTSCWWTSFPWMTVATSTTTRSGWWPERQNRTCPVGSTSIPTRRHQVPTGWSNHCPSTNSNWPTTTLTRMAMWVDLRLYLVAFLMEGQPALSLA